MSNLLKNTLRENLTAALKAKDELRLAVNRALLAAVEAKEKSGKTAIELDDDGIIAVFRSEAKKRRESAGIYAGAGAETRAARELAEAMLVEEYLPPAPPELSDYELKTLVDRAVAATRASTLQEMGAVMKVVRAAAPHADGKKTSEFVRAALTS